MRKVDNPLLESTVVILIVAGLALLLLFPPLLVFPAIYVIYRVVKSFRKAKADIDALWDERARRNHEALMQHYMNRED